MPGTGDDPALVALLREIQLREGRVIGASLRTSPTRGREALYQLLQWRDGHFGFRPGHVDAVDELGGTTTHLLLEAARRLDEGSGVWEASAQISLSLEPPVVELDSSPGP